MYGGICLTNDTPILYVFCLHGYAKVNVNSVIDNEDTDFH